MDFYLLRIIQQRTVSTIKAVLIPLLFIVFY